MYAKLKNGKLVYPPKFYRNIINYDKNIDAMKKDGYKEIIESNGTDLECGENQEYYTYYEETKKQILIKFGVRDKCEYFIPSIEERIENIENAITELAEVISND